MRQVWRLFAVAVLGGAALRIAAVVFYPWTSTSPILQNIPEHSGHEYISHTNGSFQAVASPSSKVAQGAATQSNSQATEGPHCLLLLSYQRTGSSFLGRLFHHTRNPDVFYIYEPLDPIFTAAYNFNQGWTLPTDLRTFRNGTKRSLHPEELDLIDIMLDSIFTCSMAKLPTAVLIHRFWRQFGREMASLKYTQCLKQAQIDPGGKTLETCRAHIKRFCFGRFNGAAKNLHRCRDTLYNHGAWSSTREELQARWGKAAVPSFEAYFICLNNVSAAAQACAQQHFDERCVERELRVVKTVRATMQSGLRLLARNSNAHVVHTFRDPRATSRSRLLSSWSQGSYERGNPVKIAECYCRALAEDFALTKQLTKTTGRVRHYIFDDYVMRPQEVALEMMHFAGAKVTHQMEVYLQGLPVSKRKPSQERNQKWMQDFEPQQIADINHVCQEFFATIPYDWLDAS